jgi:hypothetical protein
MEITSKARWKLQLQITIARRDRIGNYKERCWNIQVTMTERWNLQGTMTERGLKLKGKITIILMKI